MKILLDSVILIDYFNQIPQTKTYLDQVIEDAVISVVTRAEVLTGFTEETKQPAIEFLELFPLLDITKPIADLTPLSSS